MSPTSPPQAHHRFVVLDAWRGIAACLVALYHFGTVGHLQNLPFLRHSWLFVDFFFVLSGFVIFAGYEEKLKRGFGAGKFLLLRFGRLYPLHFALLFAFVASNFLRYVPAFGGFSPYKPFASPGETPPLFVSNLLLLHSVGIGDRLSFNDPSWSISAEFLTYVVFAFGIAGLKGKVRWLAFSLLLLAPAFLALRSPGYMNTTFEYGFIRCLFGFSAGALCWQLFKRYHERAASLVPYGFWHAVEIAMLILVAAFVSLAGETAFNLAAPLLFSVTVLAFAMEQGFVSRILTSRVFVLLGLWSYSIYMDHMLIRRKLFVSGGLVMQRLFHVRLITMSDGGELLGASPWQADALGALYLAVLIAVSCCTFQLIEQPGREWFKSLTHGRSRRLKIVEATSATPLAFTVPAQRQEDLP